RRPVRRPGRPGGGEPRGPAVRRQLRRLPRAQRRRHAGDGRAEPDRPRVAVRFGPGLDLGPDPQWPQRRHADLGGSLLAGRDQGAGGLYPRQRRGRRRGGSGGRAMTLIIDRTRDASGPSRGPVSAAERQRAKKRGGGLYKARVPIYPKLVHGPWRWLKWALLIAMLAIYYITPWIRCERPGSLPDQAVLLDFDGGRFYFFWIQLWPQEVYFITGLLVIAALALFLTTALFGRLWCGYACPQTVWTDLYIYVERMFEGDRNARMRLDAAPMSFNKAWRKTGKHLVWIGIAFGTGGAWIFYF